jgi:general stress protein 26
MIIWVIGFTPLSTYSQNSGIGRDSDKILITAAREIIKASGTCALITLDKKSIPMVRIMDAFPPEEDLTVWFGTNINSRKVSHIKNNPTVTLYYQDSDASGYVVIHGKAEIIENQSEKENRWKETWEAFYPNNRDGYILIKVTPNWMEVLSVSRGINGDPITWQAPILKFDKS